MDSEAVSARLRKHRAHLEQLGIKSLALFGSSARGEARPGSDVDLLIEFSRPVGLFHFMEVKEFLEEILGRRVDLVTPDALKPQLREAILEEAVDATEVEPGSSGSKTSSKRWIKSPATSPGWSTRPFVPTKKPWMPSSGTWKSSVRRRPIFPKRCWLATQKCPGTGCGDCAIS